MRGLVALWALMCVASPPVPVSAATFTPIVESFVTAVPGSPGVTFGVFPTPPAFDGQRVIFAAQQPFTSFRSLWSAVPDGSGLLNLADDNTPIPGGGGKTFGNVFPFGIANGRVVFFGNDDASQRGYYSVPATGGPLTLLVNNTTPVPGGNNNFVVDAQNTFAVDGGSVVFEDRSAIYSVPSTGGATSLVAGGGTFVCEPNYLGGGVGNFHAPDVSGGTVAIFASFGQGLLFTTPLSGLTSNVQNCPGQGTVPVATNATRVATLNTVVPGDPQDRTFDSTAFQLPIISGGTVVFGGAALNSHTFGLFSWHNGTVTRLVDTNTPVPGGTGTFQQINVGQNYTISNGQVVFRGIDAAGKVGLYYVSASGGAIVKIVAQGDAIGNGRTVQDLPNEAIGAHSLSGAKLAFIVNVIAPNVGNVKAVYVADLSTAVVASVLPSSRSVQVPGTATVFATMIATGTVTATNCSIAPIPQIPATFLYQTTNPATNALTGSPDTPVDIPAGGFQTFLLAFSSQAPFGPTDVQLSFHCDNTGAAPVFPGLNTVLLSASSNPTPDIVALAATIGNTGIVNIAGVSGAGAFAVATLNVGASGQIKVLADTAAVAAIASDPVGLALPVTITVCQTNPLTGACFGSPAPTVTTQIDAGQTPTFGIFVAGTGAAIPFDPAHNRIFVRFEDTGGVTRGATSVAVQTQ